MCLTSLDKVLYIFFPTVVLSTVCIRHPKLAFIFHNQLEYDRSGECGPEYDCC